MKALLYYTSYRVSVSAVGRCEIVFGDKTGELCYANRKMEEEIRGRAVGRCVIGSLARIMRGRNVHPWN